MKERLEPKEFADLLRRLAQAAEAGDLRAGKIECWHIPNAEPHEGLAVQMSFVGNRNLGIGQEKP